jgi:hypothetical protein
MNYFGTELTSSGHYMWELQGTQMFRNKMTLGDCPFNPEGLPYKVYKNGEARYYQFCGFTILAICGSCKDHRPGSKSIFWIEGNFSGSEMKEKILAIPIGKKIIEQCPFEIRW